MKKWQIITVGAVCGAAVIAIAGKYTYNNYVIPKYIEPVLEQVAVAVNDKKLQSDILEYVEELEDEGVLDSGIVSRYIAKYTTPEYEDYSDAFEAEDKEESLILNSAVAQAQAQLGISSVKVNDDEFDDTKYTYSEKNKENMKKSAAIAASAKAMEEEKEKHEALSANTSKYDEDDDTAASANSFGLGGFGKAQDTADKSSDKDSAKKSNGKSDKSSNSKSASDSSAPSKNSDNGSKGASLYNRAKNAMSASDLSAAYDLATKIDMSYVKSIYSDKDELKSYLSAVLTDSEIAKAMELYLKYAYLLGE